MNRLTATTLPADEIREAIPPAYTEFIGRQLMEHVAPVCRGCGAEIVWAVVEVTGSMIPLDKIPDQRGSALVVGEDATGKLIVKILGSKARRDPLARIHMPHHATCPKAAEFRR